MRGRDWVMIDYSLLITGAFNDAGVWPGCERSFLIVMYNIRKAEFEFSNRGDRYRLCRRCLNPRLPKSDKYPIKQRLSAKDFGSLLTYFIAAFLCAFASVAALRELFNLHQRTPFLLLHFYFLPFYHSPPHQDPLFHHVLYNPLPVFMRHARCIGRIEGTGLC